MRLPPRLERWREFFVRAGMETSIDPALLAAICDRESLGGDALTLPGPAGTGDGGHGRGLMQLDDRSWQSFIETRLDDGSPAWADPWSNIRFGALLLQDNIRTFKNIFAAVAAYNTRPEHVHAVMRSMLPLASTTDLIAALDRYTTGHNYVKDVFERYDKFTEGPPQVS